MSGKQVLGPTFRCSHGYYQWKWYISHHITNAYMSFVGAETIAEQLHGCKNHQPSAIFFSVGGATGPTGNWEAGFIDPLRVEVAKVVGLREVCTFYALNESEHFICSVCVHWRSIYPESPSLLILTSIHESQLPQCWQRMLEATFWCCRVEDDLETSAISHMKPTSHRVKPGRSWKARKSHKPPSRWLACGWSALRTRQGGKKTILPRCGPCVYPLNYPQVVRFALHTHTHTRTLSIWFLKTSVFWSFVHFIISKPSTKPR